MQTFTKLFMFGLGGLGACFGIAHLFRQNVSKQIKGTKLYEEAMNLLKESKGARYLLGEPITESIARFNSAGQDTEVKVLVSGPKSNGILFFTLLDEEEDKKLNTVQLQIGRDDSKRLVIKKSIEEKSNAS